jgi:hypothetical protein
VFSSHRRLSLDVLISKSLAEKGLSKAFLELERNFYEAKKIKAAETIRAQQKVKI